MVADLVRDHKSRELTADVTRIALWWTDCGLIGGQTWQLIISILEPHGKQIIFLVYLLHDSTFEMNVASETFLLKLNL